MKSKRVGIIVGGGPAPGINAVIGAATIEAINNGFEVIGFYKGFSRLSSPGFDPVKHSIRLDIPTVARIHFDGGSILETSRRGLLSENTLGEKAKVVPHEGKVAEVVSRLTLMGIDHLITIGGDDTALSARFICEGASSAIKLVHVPKTIDNDLPLPGNVDTFGYSTARYVGAGIVKNLMQDSRTTGRWYLVETMGRKAGWLALGIAQSAGATLTIIPEEFPEKISLEHVADILEGAMLKRRAMGRPDGVAVIAEGVAYRLGDRQELSKLMGRDVAVDAAGHMRLSDVPLADMLRIELQNRFGARGESMAMVSHRLGYELRSADPTPGDMAYCRSLGHGAVRLLLDDHAELVRGVLVAIHDGQLDFVPLHDIVEPDTNRTCTRVVDLNSYTYQVARAYMIRLEQADLTDPNKLANLANQAKLTPAEFQKKYNKAAACPFTDKSVPVESVAELTE